MSDDPTASIVKTADQARTRRVTGVVAIYTEDPDDTLLGWCAVDQPRRVGRGAPCDLLIHDKNLSRSHAELDSATNGIFVTDLDSHNGTFVDGRRVVEPRTFAPVGSTVRCGKTLLRVVADADAYASHPSRPGSDPMVGGPALAEVRWRIRQVAASETPVLILGETGTGKELAAQTVHAESGRKGPFVSLNSAAIPANLIESELFGHTKGSFSGSEGERLGLFRTANGGTLLLDEIGELPLDAQAKLLRVLENGEARPVGADRAIRVDVRVVAATNRNLHEMVEKGSFRADLVHRIAAWSIEMPPLRDRIEDLPLLAATFLADSGAKLTVDAMERLLACRWPGNVRELRHAVTAAASAALAKGSKRIRVEHLPSTVRRADAGTAGVSADDELRIRLETALSLRSGNVSQVARDLSMRRATVYEVLRRLGIDPTMYRRG